MRTPERFSSGVLLLGSFLYGQLASAEAPAPATTQDSLHGMYGGADAKLTPLAGRAGVLVGPHLGWTLRDVFAFGLGAYVLAHGLHPTNGDGTRTLHLTYGNLRTGYVFLPAAAVHPTALLLIGAGGVSVVERGGASSAGAALFLLEPALELELAPPAWRALRAGVAASYRVVMMPTSLSVHASDLSGPSASVFVRVGFF